MANSIKIGGFSFDALKIGSSDVDAAYLGDTLVYSGGTTPPTPPVFQGKWKATYSDGSTTSAECDSSSAITQNEINKTNLVSVEIGNCVTSLNINAFNDYTTLSSVTLSNSVSVIGAQAFRNTSLVNVELSDNVVSIGISAFYGCASLTSVTIGDGVATIDRSAFQSCTSLQEVYIGSGITNIGEQCFTFDNNITSITIMATTPPTLGANPFYGSSSPIYVPSESVDTYKAASGWSTYASRIQAIPSPQTLQWVTFSNGDTIPSDLQIYGIKGIVNDLSVVFSLNTDDDIYVEDAGRNKYNAIFGGFNSPCYNESDIISNTSVEYIFSNVGCSDYYTVSSKTIANMSNDIQLYIYA